MSEAPSERTRVRRIPARGDYDPATIHAIVDEALVCHLAWNAPEGPACVPLLHARVDDVLYVHGAPATRLAREARAGGVAVCLTVTLIDGLVLARSAFHHSVNYRSVVVYGTMTLVEDEAEKSRAFTDLLRRVAPGREDDCRAVSPAEMRATAVLRLPLAEASAKVRAGWPIDDAPDMALDHWAGVVPLTLQRGEPAPDPQLREDIELPSYLRP